MHNPWLDLPQQPPYVLPADAAPIAAFNQRARDELLVHTELLPEPFIGRRGAPIVLLSLNPGYSADDAAINARPGFIAMLRRNVQHQPNPYPFYHLDPAWDGTGAWWWGRKLKPLLSLFPRALVAQNLLCIEYFPYHSQRFGHHRLWMPSQGYGFALARDAMARGATIILARSHRLWYGAVPELHTYQRLFTLRNVQNTTISPGNCPEGFAAVTAIFRDVQREAVSHNA